MFHVTTLRQSNEKNLKVLMCIKRDFVAFFFITCAFFRRHLSLSTVSIRNTKKTITEIPDSAVIIIRNINISLNGYFRVKNK